MKPDYNIEKVRSEMLAGNKPDACRACWLLEEKNITSDRQLKNSALDFYWDRDIRAIEDDCHAGKFHTNHYKVMSSNLCNAACVTCNHVASSYWGKIEGAMSVYEIERETFDHAIDYKTAVVINFNGGESLLSKTNFYILEQLLSASNDQCVVQFSTNGSVRLTKSQKDILRRFKNLSFGVSIDGVGLVFNYMRWPLEWNEVVSNIGELRPLTNNLSVNTTASNLNIMYFPYLESWLKENNLPQHYNLVYAPAHFRPQALPYHVKQEIIKMHNNEFVELVLNKEHTDKDDVDYTNCLTQIARQDKLKKTNIRDYLPEFCKLISLE